VGEKPDGKNELEINSTQRPKIDEAAFALMWARRFAMLRRFMRKGRASLSRFAHVRKGKTTKRGKIKGKVRPHAPHGRADGRGRMIPRHHPRPR